MLKLLIDTNVVLDVVLKRGQAGLDGAALLSDIELGRADGCVAAHCVATVHYIVAREAGAAAARLAVTQVLRLLPVVQLATDDFHTALALDMADFEDAIQSAAALAAGAKYIVTSNKKDFRRSPVPARTAGEILPLLIGSKTRKR